MKAFIAIDIPEALYKSVKRFQSSLNRANIFDATWTIEYHITLKFLGYITAEKQLKKMINDEFVKLNFESETTYTNHLTLARVKAITNKPAWLDISKSNENKSFGKFKVNSIKLYESKLRQGRFRYNIVKEFILA